MPCSIAANVGKPTHPRGEHLPGQVPGRSEQGENDTDRDDQDHPEERGEPAQFFRVVNL